MLNYLMIIILLANIRINKMTNVLIYLYVILFYKWLNNNNSNNNNNKSNSNTNNYVN